MPARAWGVIPNLLDYPALAFVLDFKGENYAVTPGAFRELEHHVILVDPFGITENTGHALNWLDTLGPTLPMWSVAPPAWPTCW